MIDVIIPAYNCCSTLDRTLGSLVSQTDKNFKVTIVDDCSTEDVKSLVNKYYELLNIRYIRNDTNVGCGMSRQVGIDNTYCKYFTFLDSDDVFMPYTVELFNSITRKNSNVGFVHTYIYEQNIINGNASLSLIKNGFSYCHGKLYNRELITKFEIKNSPLIKWHDDSYFNSMCAELMDIKIIEIPTVVWCFNSNSITRKADRERKTNVRLDFLKAMCMSKDFVLKYKDSVDHIVATVSNMEEFELNEEEKELLNYLKGE